MARGNDGRKVFLNDSDYEAFLDGLTETQKLRNLGKQEEGRVVQFMATAHTECRYRRCG
jgi:hypothetical protein